MNLNEHKKFISEIKTNYPALHLWSDGCALELYKKIQEHQILKEFLYTINSKKTIDQLKSFNNITISVSNEKILVIYNVLLSETLSGINKILDAFGWFPASIENKGGGKYSSSLVNFINKSNVIITYEAKYDVEVIPTVKYLYHLCPDLKWSKIKTLGLTPKTQAKISDHPARIYLMTQTNDLSKYGGDIMDVAFSLLNNYPLKDKVKEMLVLKIDLSKLKNTKFFIDPNFHLGEGIWTNENIPPYAITIDNRLDITF